MPSCVRPSPCPPNCECGSNPVVVSETTQADEDPQCINCGNSEDSCGCVSCERCSTTVESVCENCNNCTRCCQRRGECYACDECNSVTSNTTCDACGYCDGCCGCYTCDNCGNRVDTNVDIFCNSCDSCESCCSCGTEMHCQPIEAKYYNDDGSLFCWPTKLHERKLNPSGRMCSAEIEVARLENTEKAKDIERVCSKWGAGIVSDGSLPETGFEINTCPASGDKFINQIGEICASLAACKAKVTSDCGLHVHCDARDFSYWEVRRLILLYARLEEALFNIVATSRQNNHYCRKCGDEYLKAIEKGSPKKMKDAICQAVYKKKDIRHDRSSKYSDSRYHALNLHSWFYRGTIECRLFGGTTEAHKIQNWGMLWCGILDWVYKHTDKDIVAFNGKTSIEVLLAICPNEKVRQWVEARYKAYQN